MVKLEFHSILQVLPQMVCALLVFEGIPEAVFEAAPADTGKFSIINSSSSDVA